MYLRVLRRSQNFRTLEHVLNSICFVAVGFLCKQRGQDRPIHHKENRTKCRNLKYRNLLFIRTQQQAQSIKCECLLLTINALDCKGHVNVLLCSALLAFARALFRLELPSIARCFYSKASIKMMMNVDDRQNNTDSVEMKLLKNKVIYITQIHSLHAPQRKVCSIFTIVRNILINSVRERRRVLVITAYIY